MSDKKCRFLQNSDSPCDRWSIMEGAGEKVEIVINNTSLLRMYGECGADDRQEEHGSACAYSLTCHRNYGMKKDT
ncbi:hypothetical protein PoB_006199300 [Plakobranchus ocellatus]|uniref:Uncharacterized protein n=1 Tax=Plakobranchus ocellatus TaxID=259542 RepID=A0AAV4CU94_9GAST|nr:hypothetical protein PoB_006199300 [Plakobranchus ocellatus]